MKKYILLIIGLLMIANNAVAESAFDKQGRLIAPQHLTLAEAYSVMKGHSKNVDNQFTFVVFEMGVLVGIANAKNFEKDLSEKTDKCINRPLGVLNNAMFGLYEKGRLDGEIPFGSAMQVVITAQCFND